MSSITAWGTCVPRYRLPTTAVRDQWGGGSSGVRSKAVAAVDDDPVTLGIRAAKSACAGSKLDVILFATSTPVYTSGSVVSDISTALGCGESVMTATFQASSRAGTTALRVGHDVVEAEGGRALVVAADVPKPAPDSEREHTAGAGAAAAVVDHGAEEGLTLVGRAARTRAILDEWVAPDEGERHHADTRYARDYGYVETTAGAIEDLLEAKGWEPGDVAGLAATQPNPQFLERLAQAADLGDDVRAPDLVESTGDLGSAGALVALGGDSLRKGDRIVVAGYGSGAADALAYEVRQPLDPLNIDPDATEEITYLEYLHATDGLRDHR